MGSLTRALTFSMFFVGSAAAQDAGPKPLDIGDRVCLFFDDHFIAEQRGFKRTWHQGKPQAEPAIAAKEPWEKWPHLFGSVLYDPVTRLYKMWYEDVPDRGAVLYAESMDGKSWTRPKLKQYKLRGSEENNCVLYPAELPNVFLDPNEKDPQARFKMVAWGGPFGPKKVSGHIVFSSFDGITWKLIGSYSGPSVTDDTAKARIVLDTNEVIWDSLGRRYFGTYRTFPSHPGLMGFVRDEKYRMFPKEGGHRRAVGVTTAKSLMGPWSPIVNVLKADARDDEKVKKLSQGKGPNWAELYIMPVFPRGNHYVGMVSLLYLVDASAEALQGKIPGYAPDSVAGGGDLQLTFSHDGLKWSRHPERQTLVAPSPTKLTPCYAACNEPLVLGDEMWIYYTEATSAHPRSDHKAYIRAAVWRKDGFVSMDAEKAATLVTKPLAWGGKHLSCNFKIADGGELRVGLRDEAGKPLPGFGLQDCDPVRGDHVERVLRWNGKTDLSSLQGRTLRIQFALSAGSLYSFRGSAD